jgi:hypothetical protein
MGLNRSLDELELFVVVMVVAEREAMRLAPDASVVFGRRAADTAFAAVVVVLVFRGAAVGTFAASPATAAAYVGFGDDGMCMGLSSTAVAGCGPIRPWAPAIACLGA